MMKNRHAIGLISLLGLCLPLLLTSCTYVDELRQMAAAEYKEPTVELVNLRLGSLSLIDQKLKVRLRVFNPNDLDIPVSSLSCFVRLEDVDMASGILKEPFVIPALGSHEFEMNVSVSLLKMGGPIVKFLRSDSEEVNYYLSGNLKTDLLFAGPLAFEKRGRIAVER